VWTSLKGSQNVSQDFYVPLLMLLQFTFRFLV